MKKIFIYMLMVILLFTSCQVREKNQDMQKEKKNSEYKNETETKQPESFSSIQVSNKEYILNQEGKETWLSDEARIYFSDRDIVCYVIDKTERETEQTEEIFYLYDRKKKERIKILSVYNWDSTWGNMYRTI